MIQQGFKLKWLFFLPLTLFYNNCDGFQSGDQAVRESGVCPVTQKASLALSQFSINDCNDLTLIDCESREYRPDISSGESLIEQCFTSTDIGTVCLDLKTHRFDTGAAVGPAELFAEGEAYNYKEFNCYYKKFLNNDQAIFQSSAETLEKAVTDLYQNCRKEDL